MDNNIEDALYSKHVIDNRKVSMVDTLKFLLKQPEYRILDVAVGYFYISGLLLLKDEFIDFMDHRNGHLRILMGNETNGSTVNVLDESKYNNYAELINNVTNRDADKISDKEFLGKVNEWVKNGKIEVKVYTGKANYFHAKSYLFASTLDSSRGTAIVGSSNFSRDGLKGNTELNVLTQDGYFSLHEWYNTLWLSKDEVTDFSPDLIKIVKSHGAQPPKQEYKPVKETYYDFANLFAKPYTTLDETQNWTKRLFPHQKTGVVSVKEKLDAFDTAVLSDGVGLGKTRTTAGVIKLYLESQTVNNILIVADTKLKDQWHDELEVVGVDLDELHYMSRQKLVGEPVDFFEKNNYTLVVIDEAHLGFKNNNTEAYRKVRLMKESNPSLKGLLLTATPWNNQREDVINLGSLFLNTDAIPNDRDYKQYYLQSGRVTNKIVKHLAKDDVAFRQFWEDIYLQRTRKTYGGKGTKFPHRNFPQVDIPYEPRKNEIFANNFDIISNLTFPYQDPIKYIDDSKEQLGAKQLKMLLLKRADSSYVAFKNSLKNIQKKVKKLRDVDLNDFKYLKGKKLLDRYKSNLNDSYNLESYSSKYGFFLNDEEDTISNVRRKRYVKSIRAQINSITLSQAKRAISQMEADCNNDFDTLEMLINTLDKAYSKVDEKVTKIIECIDKERSKGHKIILVSQFSDTVDYYYNVLYKHYNSQKINLPMGKIIGGNNNEVSALLNDKRSTKKKVLEHLSPISKENQEIIDKKSDIDLVVATDTISTGQNLQDAVTLMNIDLPYNPMTLEQRIGRIDRPLTRSNQSDQIYIYTFPIYESINSQLKMMKRLGNKLAGALNDTEFDNVVLPEYKNYLKDIKEKRNNAVKSMLDKTDDQLMEHSDTASEKHSEQYVEANHRMYNFKINQIKPLANPLIPNYSFSNGKGDSSVAVIEVEFKDANDGFLNSMNIIVNADNGKRLGIVPAEKSLNHEIDYDIHNSNKLNINKAMLLANSVKDRLKNTVDACVDRYNKQREFAKENIDSLNSKISREASKKLMNSARANQELAMQKLNSVGVKPSELKNICKFIATISPEDDLFEIVKEINSNPDVFWMNIKDYMKLFNPETINLVEKTGKKIKTVDTRKASKDKTTFKVLTCNIVLK